MCTEIGCLKENTSLRQLRTHLNSVHKKNHPTEKKYFTSMEDFKSWKIQYEKEQGFKLSEYDSYKRKKCYTYYYRCNMCTDNRYKNTTKMDLHCTAGVTVKEMGNSVNIEIYPTHYNHVILFRPWE